jgi:hypothetical protein
MALTWPQGREMILVNVEGEFATLRANVSHYGIKINPKSNLISSSPSFHLSYSMCFHNENSYHHHCMIMLMKFNLLQWHNYSNNVLNCHEKHKSYKTLGSMHIHGGDF